MMFLTRFRSGSDDIVPLILGDGISTGSYFTLDGISPFIIAISLASIWCWEKPRIAIL